MVARIARIIREIHAQGTAVVLVEQNATMALQVADHAAVLEVGRVALSGPAAELAASDDVQRLYLGGHAESQAAGRVRGGRGQGAPADPDPVAVGRMTAGTRTETPGRRRPTGRSACATTSASWPSRT